MSRGFYTVPKAYNEPIKDYAPGSKERIELKKMIAEMRSKVADIPMFIGGQEIRTDDKREIHPPHDKKHLLGYYYYGNAEHVNQAIDAALESPSEMAGNAVGNAGFYISESRRPCVGTLPR